MCFQRYLLAFLSLLLLCTWTTQAEAKCSDQGSPAAEIMPCCKASGMHRSCCEPPPSVSTISVDTDCSCSLPNKTAILTAGSISLAPEKHASDAVPVSSIGTILIAYVVSMPDWEDRWRPPKIPLFLALRVLRI